MTGRTLARGIMEAAFAYELVACHTSLPVLSALARMARHHRIGRPILASVCVTIGSYALWHLWMDEGPPTAKILPFPRCLP